MKLLSGKVLSDKIKDELSLTVANMREAGIVDNITLAVIQIGDDPASSVYIRNKSRACEYVGIDSVVYHADEDVTEEEIIELIEKLNDSDEITGILLQLPLPEHLDEQKILPHINPMKDVDGFHYENAGLMFQGRKDVPLPCTPKGIVDILDYYDIDVAGKECVVVGRSNIVGKPIAMMLLQADATVTICHSKTKNLKEVCKRADILIAAIGKPKFFNEEYVKEGAVVIDVGINRDENGKLCGDVDADAVSGVAGALTPVPGCVGIMTVTELMCNVVQAAWNQKKGGADAEL